MDQYPYSIPPPYQYPESIPDKNTTSVQDETSLPAQNPYYLNPGSTNTGFGFSAVQQQHQQQQMVSQTSAPVTVPANGLMSQFQSGVAIGYDPYPNQAFHNQVPPVAVNPIMAMDSAVSAVSSGMETLYGPQSYAREAIVGGVPLAYPVQPVLLPSMETTSQILPIQHTQEPPLKSPPSASNAVPTGTDIPAAVNVAPSVPVEPTVDIAATPQETGMTSYSTPQKS